MKKNKLAMALALTIGITAVPAMSPEAAAYNGWEKYGSDWYYYTNGSMKTGWVNDGGTWYYLNGNGVMKTGWQKVNGTWYYLNSNGSMKTGWLNDGGTWYYLNGDGSMKTGWLNNGSAWYYLNGNGSMKTGWLNSGSTWYFLKNDGAMASGWYHVTSDGAMAAGTVKDYNGKQYYFNKDGAWVENTSDSFRLSADDALTTNSKSIVVTIINRTDHDFEVNADDNYLQKIDKDGLWNILNLKKDSKKIGKMTVYAHSSANYTIDVDTLEGGKLEAGKYKVYNYLGDKYYEYEFEVKEAEGVVVNTERKTYASNVDSKVKYSITNNTDSDVDYGAAYSIQKKVNGQWKDVALKSDEFIEIACIIKPHETAEESFDIDNIDEEKPIGDYRLVKDVNGTKYYAEFSFEYSYV